MYLILFSAILMFSYWRLKAVFSRCKVRGFHARGVYPTQDTSRMGTAWVKQEQKADTRIIFKK